MLVPRVKTFIALLLLRMLRAMVSPKLEVHVIPRVYSTSPRAQRRALGKLIAKSVTRGVPGGARLG